MLIFGKHTTGAADDLIRATDVARTMVTRYGMDETLGYVTYDSERQSFIPQTGGYFPPVRNYSDQTAWQIDEAVRQLIITAFETATHILRLRRQLLDQTATVLLAKETLTADELSVIEPFRKAGITDFSEGSHSSV